MKKLSETEIRNSIVLYLWSKGVYAWVNNTTGVYSERLGIYTKLSKYHKIGSSDILGILDRNKVGRFLAIEVKKNKNEKPTASQAEFLKEVVKAGGVGFVAWDLKTVAKKLERYL